MKTECVGIKGGDNGTERGKEMKSGNRGGVRVHGEDTVNGQRVGRAERKELFTREGKAANEKETAIEER